MNEVAVVFCDGTPIMVVSNWMIAQELIGTGNKQYSFRRLPVCDSTTDAIKVAQAEAGRNARNYP